MKRLCSFLLCILLLAACGHPEPSVTGSELAAELSTVYGIEILTGRNATDFHPWDYVLLPETDEQEILNALEALEQQLQNYPKGMLEVLSRDCGGLHICIVKEIQAKEGSGGIENAKGLQFHIPEGSFIALSQDREYTLYHELCHVIEDYALTRTDAWDRWEDLNPLSFDYDLDFEANQKRDGSLYLQEENRSFIDTYSMSFPREDRARIMEYAMTEGNGHYFASPIMQAKLSLLSMGIRQAFGLEKSEQNFLWEQYLKQ